MITAALRTMPLGDSPIIGAGVFADNEICGLSTSGHGESFLASHFSGFVIAEIRAALRQDDQVFVKNPERLKQILQAELDELKRKMPGRGGIIVIPPNGDPQYLFNSNQMAVGLRVGGQGKVRVEEVLVAGVSS